MWILYSCIYAVLIGVYWLFKKKATTTSGVFSVLALATSFSFLLISFEVIFATSISKTNLLLILIKSFVVVGSWSLQLTAIKHLELSFYAPISVLSVVITFLFGVIVFDEELTIIQIIGAVIIIIGLVLMNLTNVKHKQKNVEQITLPKKTGVTKYVLMAVGSAIFTATSSIFDKIILQTSTTFEMQFWFLLFTAAILWVITFIISICKKQFIIKKSDLKNYWIYLMGLFLAVADFSLFLAYGVPDAKLSLISIITRLNVLVTTLLGIIVLKEKNVWKRLIFLFIILGGAVLVAL